MKLLAIDTAFEACSVAVDPGDGRPPVARSERVVRGHAERLFGMMATAMEAAAVTFADLDRIAVTTGPGSFTGVRVGIAAARGVALVAKCPIVGVTTLAVHAATARACLGAIPVLALVDARRGELYGQRFTGAGEPVDSAQVASADFFASMLECGDVLAGAAAESVENAFGARTLTVAHRLSSPDICSLADLGAGERVAAAAPRPLYLRPPDAKPQGDRGVVRR